MSKIYVEHDYKITGKDYIDTDGADIPGGISYSTEEQDTGLTWIDGRKIYQKTIKKHGDSAAAGTFLDTEIPVSDLGADVFLSGMAYDEQGQVYPCTVVFMASRTHVGVALNVGGRSLDAYTFTYVKTE